MTDVFIGRQPIFDRSLQVYAYEILFRSSDQPTAAGMPDGDSATSQVIINTFANLGLDKIVGDSRAFINLTRIFLSNPDLIVAPPERIVLEVLEDVEPSDTILETLETLRQQGHTIALDDFIYDERFTPFIKLAHIVKIDVMALTHGEIEQHVNELRNYGVKLLAEKVETQQEFEFLKQLEFDYYQGYFFSRPSIVRGKAITANQIAVLELVSKIHDPGVEVEDLSRIIATDVSLSHKVFKFVNSPLTGLRSQVDSIQQAVVLLGLTTIKNWVTILALATGSNKPSELSRTALIRARCCEMIARQCQLPKPESFFTVGLFSSLDAMMDQPLDELLTDLPLSNDAKAALLSHQGIFGKALGSTLAMEKCDFGLIGFESLDLNELSDIYYEAIDWADQLMADL